MTATCTIISNNNSTQFMALRPVQVIESWKKTFPDPLKNRPKNSSRGLENSFRCKNVFRFLQPKKKTDPEKQTLVEASDWLK